MTIPEWLILAKQNIQKSQDGALGDWERNRYLKNTESYLNEAIELYEIELAADKLTMPAIEGVMAMVVGWTHAHACIGLDQGKDPRKTIVPRILEEAKKDLLDDLNRMFGARPAEKLVPLSEEKVLKFLEEEHLEDAGIGGHKVKSWSVIKAQNLAKAICDRFGSVPVVPEVCWPEELKHSDSCDSKHYQKYDSVYMKHKGEKLCNCGANDYNEAIKTCKAAFDAAVKKGNA